MSDDEYRRLWGDSRPLRLKCWQCGDLGFITTRLLSESGKPEKRPCPTCPKGQGIRDAKADALADQMSRKRKRKP